MSTEQIESKLDTSLSDNGSNSSVAESVGLSDSFDRFARFYDDDYRDYDHDIDLLLALAEQSVGPFLELGSGTGRALLPLAMQGHQITGVDISPSLHKVAEKKLAASGCLGNTELVEADMRNVQLPSNEYAFAFCMSNTLMHCTSQAEQIAVMNSAYQHLRSGALFLIDLFNPDIEQVLQVQNVMELADSWTDEENGTEVLKWSVRTIDICEQLQDTLFIYEEIFSDGQIRRTPCPFQLRFLWRSEGELMLRAAGFAVEEVWGDFDYTPYDSASERLIFLARKP